MGDNRNSRGTEFFGSPQQVLDGPRENVGTATQAQGTPAEREISIEQNAPPSQIAPPVVHPRRFTLDLPDLDEEPTFEPFTGLPAASGSPARSSPPSFVALDASPESPPRVPAYVLEEVAQMVQEALARFAVPGALELTAREAVLRGPQGERRVPIDFWLKRWPTLDNVSRRERTSEVARRLAQGRQASPALQVARPRLVIDVRLVLACLVLLGLFGFLYFDAKSSSSTESSNSASHSENAQPSSGEGISVVRERETTGRQDSVARDSRVCEATRARVFQGGTVGLADLDGWLVEIALLKKDGKDPLDTHPDLQRFFQEPGKTGGSLYIWPEETLSETASNQSLVQVSRLEIGAPAERLIPGVVFTFAGSLVDPYFDEATRSKYFHLASELATTLQATHAAVYARCFDDDTHAIGTWFMGLDSGGASAALLYFMGTYARPPHIALPFSRPPGESELNRLHAFNNIAANTARLDRASLATILGSQGGMATGKAGGPVIIHFPFRDGNRASRASRAIARVTSLSE